MYSKKMEVMNIMLKGGVLMIQKMLEKGQLSIFDDAIKIITGMTFSEVEDVTLSTFSLKRKILEKVQKGSSILVNYENEQLTIQVRIAIKYGVNIKKTANRLQQLIKNHVEMFTGVSVKEVNVTVNQIVFDM